jgi:hypothetical protein
MSGSSVGGGVTSTHWQATNRTSNEAITTMALHSCAIVRSVRYSSAWQMPASPKAPGNGPTNAICHALCSDDLPLLPGSAQVTQRLTASASIGSARLGSVHRLTHLPPLTSPGSVVSSDRLWARMICLYCQARHRSYNVSAQCAVSVLSALCQRARDGD